MVSYAFLCVYWKWPSAIQHYQFVSVLVAGFMIHLACGHLYTYGNMVPYMVSYIRNQSAPADLKSSETLYLYSLQVVCFGTCLTLGGVLERYLGPRIVCLSGGWIMSLGVALTYFTIQHSFWLTFLTYGLMFGIGAGLGCITSLALAIRWLPKHKGVAAGIVLSGFGISALLFNFVQTAYINPHNYLPNLVDGDNKYFTQQDLINRVPFVFLILALIYSVIQSVSCIFLVNPSPSNDYSPPTIESEGSQDECQDDDKQYNNAEKNISSGSAESKESVSPNCDSINLSPHQMLTKLNFYLLCIILFCSGLSAQFIMTLYKAFGQSLIDNDHFLTAAGSVGAVSNLLGRILWGALADKTSYKLALLLQNGAMCFLLYTFYSVSTVNPALYFIWLCCIMFCIGGLYCLVPTAVAKAFGSKFVGINYGIVYIAMMMASVVGSFIVDLLERVVDWDWMFVVFGGFVNISYITALCYQHKIYEARD